MLNSFIKNNFDVIFMNAGCSYKYIDPSSIDSKVKVIEIARKKNWLACRINNLSYLLFKKFIFFTKVSNSFIKETSNYINNYNLNERIFFMGIEKKGLIWANELNKTHKAKLIYYSLELYEFPEFYEKTEFYYLRKNEKLAYINIDKLIIQDYMRFNEITRYNNFKLDKDKVSFFPVSVRRSNHRSSKNSICNQTILLYFGKIAKHRYAEEICKISQDLTDRGKVWLHGMCEESYKNYLLDKYRSPRLEITNNLIDSNEILTLINQASIGICLYRVDNVNDKLTAFSSEKVALYLSLGIPIITFKNESYNELFKEFKCGVGITELSQVINFIDEILNNYEKYSSEALRAFSHFYDFDNNFENLIKDNFWTA